MEAHVLLYVTQMCDGRVIFFQSQEKKSET